MNRRTTILAAGGIVLLTAGWALFRPELLFVNRTVNDSFPLAVNATLGGADSGAVLSGAFTGLAHETRGTASIHVLADGRRVLRLTDFETSNGPDVRVLLVAAPQVADSDTVRSAGYVELGALKGNVGNQNYDVPASTDLEKYRSVVIWCNRFGVSFAAAPLGSAGTDAAAASRVVATGSFHDGAHATSGTATIHLLPDGKRVLRLTGFETSNGPDVRVLLVAAPDATDNETVKNAGYVELGSLKGNIGDQNYDVPGDVQLSRYRAVTIWCNRFGVNFGTAPLSS